jgi:DNA-binding transcriptional LysR family regulator
VVEHGGFAPAGRALGLPKSKLSRRVALLEERLGAQLLLRSTRSFAVTEVGKRYYQHCRAMLTEAEAAEESVALVHSEPCGKVRMSCPVALLASRVGRMLGEFMRQYPRVELQVDETNRRVDVVGEGLDLALRVRPPPLQDSDLALRTLAERRQCLVAAPELLQRLGQPGGPWICRLAQPGYGRRAGNPPLGAARTRRRARRGQAPAAAGDAVHAGPARCGSAGRRRGAAAQHVRARRPAQRHAGAGAAGLGAAPEIIHAVYASRRGQLPPYARCSTIWPSPSRPCRKTEHQNRLQHLLGNRCQLSKR